MIGSWRPDDLPNLNDTNGALKSSRDTTYNCIAFAIGDEESWWWPSEEGYWPDNVPLEVSVQAFIEAFGTRGYVPCLDSSLEPEFEKVALYGRIALDGNLRPTHAAKQLPDGRWASKLGPLEDVEHFTLEAVSCPTYGAPVCYLRRQRPTAAFY